MSYDKAAKKLVLRQFHVEGFVNHYVLESVSEDGRTIVFVTAAIENIAPGFRGRPGPRPGEVIQFRRVLPWRIRPRLCA